MFKYTVISHNLAHCRSFLSSGTPGYFSHTLIPYSCKYNTRRGSIQKMFLEVPQFCPPVHKSKKQFNNSLAFDAPAIWNVLLDELRPAPSFISFRKHLKLISLK